MKIPSASPFPSLALPCKRLHYAVGATWPEKREGRERGEGREGGAGGELHPRRPWHDRYRNASCVCVFFKERSKIKKQTEMSAQKQEWGKREGKGYNKSGIRDHRSHQKGQGSTAWTSLHTVSTAWLALILRVTPLDA